MRGNESKQQPVFSYVSLEERVPADPPLRAIRGIVDEILAGMSKSFDKVYAESGRPSIPPERLLRALLLQLFFSVHLKRTGVGEGATPLRMGAEDANSALEA